MTDSSETAPRRSAAITTGLVTAVAFGGLCLAAGLWDPIPAFPLALTFLASAYGIHKRRNWSAYGGALLLAAMAALVTTYALRAPGPGFPAASIAATLAILGAGMFALYRAAVRMPAASTPGSRGAWIALAVLVLVCPQFCRAYAIASGSMENTIRAGDRVLVLPITRPPDRGDIVIHRYPADRSQSFVKRVVAIGGDRVRLRDKQLIVNGTLVNEPYALHKTDFVDAFRDNFPSQPSNVKLPERWTEELRADTVNSDLVVPPGKFFVLGDNRDESLDSRYFGFLERADFTGKPVLIYFSAEAHGPGTNPPALLHPSTIRWGRIFRELER